VTAVSESLKADTLRELSVTSDIRVIPNFLNLAVHRHTDASALRARLARPDEKVVIHVSNFRPVKRTPDVVRIFAEIRAALPARLLMVGGGPDRDAAEALAAELGVSADIWFLGEQEQVMPLLSASDLFLLPSAQESFGLAALEAMACHLPVIASRVGGLPEVIEDGTTGFLHPFDDLGAMARSAIALLRDEPRRRQMGLAGARIVRDRFGADRIVGEYERFYQEILRG
jgi:L-malate glycosyltransferase